MKVYIKGMADAGRNKGVSAYATMSGKRILSEGVREHKGVIKSKTLEYPIKEYGQQCQYLTELWALNWAFTQLQNQKETVTVYTNSVAVCSWINKRECKDTYKDMFGIYLNLSANMEVKAEQVNVGDDTTLKRLRAQADILLYLGK